jgi:dinuclear metal center YbgI/SA1388 family protein
MQVLAQKQLIGFLEELAPTSLQEGYDNSGWIVKLNDDFGRALLSLDCTPEVVEEARQEGCDLIISHHPIVFKGLKRLTGQHYTEQAVIMAIQAGISLYAIHTNLDNVLYKGVNQSLAQRLGLERGHILRPMKGQLCKLSIFVPKENTTALEAALFAAGAGRIGNYADCSFLTQGLGSFKPIEGAEPRIGKLGARSFVEENRVEVLVENWRVNAVLQSARLAHPYEEMAYDLVSLENEHQCIGSGWIGFLPKAFPVQEFLDLLKKRLPANALKYTPPIKSSIEKVAICGGAGGFLLPDAIQAGADVLVTADFKYHEYFDAHGKIMVVDPGHYETEHHLPEHISALLKEKFPNFATLISQVNTNPVNYY